MAKQAAIVTGAGSGIGRAVALALAAKGYRVALVGRTRNNLETVADEIQKMGGEAAAEVADVSQWEAVEKMVQRVAERWGRIDVVVNNAGMVVSAGLSEMEPATWRAVLEGNVSAAFYMTKAVWDVMKRTGGGVIVNISSMAARDPFAGLGAYAVAKSGVNMLTLVSAREGDAAGIRVVAIAPGAVETQMLRWLVGDAEIPVMTPDEVAAAIMEAVAGGLRYASGETIYLHRRA
jgi:NAD(P)-dependent dehydrogenase (short-subunit alcohol dehydrogenase family)